MLLERDHELSVLQAQIGAAARGESGLLLIQGPAGIGKSRLVGEACRTAGEAGLHVLSARGGELEL